MSVVTSIEIKIRVSEGLDSGENRAGQLLHSFDKIITLESGTGALQADRCFSDRRTLANGAGEVLDFAGGLTDSFGAALTIAKMRLVVMNNRSSTDGEDFSVGPDATNGWVGLVKDASDKIRVPAGGFFIWYDPNGQAVAAGSTDELYPYNDGTASNSYDMLAVGTSA